MSRLRISSSKLINLPQTRQSIQRKQQILKQYHRSLFSQQNQRQKKRQINTAPYGKYMHDKIQGNRLQKLKMHQQNIQQEQTESVKFRPYTQSNTKFQKRLQSPLSVLRTNSKMNNLTNKKQFSSCDNHTKSQTKFRMNFLKKGTSIDKSIIINVLKSKANLNVCTNTFSYVNDPRNEQLVKMIQKQIPRGLRDIIGAQEMIRMSHIMTGANFNSINMTKRLNSKLQKKKIVDNHQSQDNMTLKSIKRW